MPLAYARARCSWWKMENLKKMIALRVLRANGCWADYFRDCQACVCEWIQAVGVSSGARWMDVLASPGRMVPR